MKKKSKNSNELPVLVGAGLLIFLLFNKKSSSGSGGGSGVPRGLRNNNIGNIKINDNNAWLGKVPKNQNTDGVFEQFTTKEYGTRAMLKLLARYYNEFDLFNIDDIISRYSSQASSHYKSYLANKMNLTTISFIEPGRMFELAYNMAYFENGAPATTLNELKAVATKYNINFI